MGIAGGEGCDEGFLFWGEVSEWIKWGRRKGKGNTLLVHHFWDVIVGAVVVGVFEGFAEAG